MLLDWDLRSGCEIIARMATHSNMSHDLIQVILGGGRRAFLPNTTADPEYPDKRGKRMDDRDLTKVSFIPTDLILIICSITKYATIPISCTVTIPISCTVAMPISCTVTIPILCTVTMPMSCTVTILNYCNHVPLQYLLCYSMYLYIHLYPYHAFIDTTSFNNYLL